MDSKAKVLSQRQLLDFYGYPADFWQKYQKGIESVTAADVERVAKKYVHPEQLAILIVGNEKDFDKPLATAFGKVTPIDITIPEPNAATSTTTKPTGSSADAKALINKVRDFVGGAAAVGNVKSVRQIGTLSLKTPQGPMDVDMDSMVRFPDQRRQVIKTPMGEMTIVSNSSGAFVVTPAGAQDLPASRAQSMRNQSHEDLLSVVKNIDNPAYTFNVVGSDNGAQILEVNAEGNTFKLYVDPATGRIIKRVSHVASGDQTTEFSDWKATGGINLPTTFVVTGGDQSGSGKMTSIEVNPNLDPKAFEKP